jgi:amidohydrolase
MDDTIGDLVRGAVTALAPDYVATRHHLHQNPELSDREEKTSALVVERLRRMGMENVRAGIGGHGVIATLKGALNGPTIALRADMDALPIQEQSDLAYRSCVPGVMHACGHDGHTATLLGAAATLTGLRDRLPGTVRFIFQPAEETVGGAARMCGEGAMDGVDAIVALHGWPGMAVGQIGVRPGPMMASSDTFDITLKGRGAHAAYPHLSVDPILVGAQLVMALQSVVSREMSPIDSVVVTVAQFHAGTAYNIIPGTAELKGTVRCLSSVIQDAMPERLERIAAGICMAAGAEYGFRYQRGTPVTINDAAVNALVAEVGTAALGAQNVISLEAPSMGAEDFAMYLKHAPGAMFRLGVGEQMTPLHTPTYNFADDAVATGMELFARIVIRYLESQRAAN